VFCWHYDACVVLYGKQIIEDQLTYIYLDESTEEISDDNSQYDKSKGGDCWHYETSRKQGK